MLKFNWYLTKLGLNFVGATGPNMFKFITIERDNHCWLTKHPAEMKRHSHARHV